MYGKLLVVIGTRNRPDRLDRTLKAISKQNRLPSLVVICDSSDASIRDSVAVSVARSDLQIILEFTERKSVNVQRNIAIRRGLKEGNFTLVQILDDDTEPLPGYFDSQINWLNSHVNCVGVSGITVPSSRRPEYSNAFTKRLHYLCGTDSKRQGDLTEAGVNIPIYSDAASPTKVEWLMGCSMWKREVFAEIEFNETFLGSSLGDDIEFSCRAKSFGSLWTLPNALLRHDEEPAERPNSRLHSFRYVRNRWEIIRAMGSSASKARFWASVVLTGLIQLRNSISMNMDTIARSENRTALAGTVAGSLATIQGKPPR